MTSHYLAEAYHLFSYTQALRRDFHSHPELGFEEVRTAGIVERELRGLGLEVQTGMAKTGVTALIEGKGSGPVVLLRFDMDALPIEEQTGAVYASLNPGLMHACGHDGHTAIGLTVARILHKHRHEWVGAVKLVFQPAEEGLGGAELMITEGILQSPRPDFALALHLWNEKSTDWLGITDGATLAGAEIFHVHVVGKGGHGAIPEKTIDPVLASAEMITGLQSIVSRNVSPLDTAVISVTMVHGGDAFNVIPSVVDLHGTIRTFDAQVRNTVLKRFDKIIQGTGDIFGCQVEVKVDFLTPAVVNQPEVAQLVRGVAREMLPEKEISADFRSMVSEDMAFMLQEIPGCYFFIGSANTQKGLDYPHHHPCFDFDENVLPQGAALMAASAIQLLNQPPHG